MNRTNVREEKWYTKYWFQSHFSSDIFLSVVFCTIVKTDRKWGHEIISILSFGLTVASHSDPLWNQRSVIQERQQCAFHSLKIWAWKFKGPLKLSIYYPYPLDFLIKSTPFRPYFPVSPLFWGYLDREFLYHRIIWVVVWVEFCKPHIKEVLSSTGIWIQKALSTNPPCHLYLS